MDNLNELKVDTKNIDNIVNEINLTIAQLENLVNLITHQEELNFINETKTKFEEMKNKYEKDKTTKDNKNKIIGKVKSTLDNIKQQYDRTITDTQKNKNAFENDRVTMIKSFINIFIE